MPDDTGTEAGGFPPDPAAELELGLPPDAEQGVTRQTLHENAWVSLKVVRKPGAGVNGYVYSHETRCQGRIVAVLPYRDTPSGREYLVKSEMTPCWGFDQVLSAVTGGYEGGDIEDDAVREMLEETGYTVTRDELIPLGESYASKSADTVYSLFSVDLTGQEAGEATGDGTRVEAESAAIWVRSSEMASMRDPQLHVMCLRLSARPEGPGRTPPFAKVVTREQLGSAIEDALGESGITLIRETELDALRAEVAEYGNGISWNTSCTSCAKVLDSSYRDHARAEKAERALSAVRGYALDPATPPGVRDALQALLAAGGWEVIP